MSHFSVELPKLIKNGFVLDYYAVDLKISRDGLYDVCGDLDSSFDTIVPILEGLARQVDRESLQVHQLSKGIFDISKCYITNENNIVSNQKKLNFTSDGNNNSANNTNGNEGAGSSDEAEGNEAKTEFEKSLVDVYGFTEEEANLVADAYDKFFNSPETQGMSNEEKIHEFFRNLAALHPEYSNSSTLFGNMCDTPSTDDAKAFFSELGVDADALQAAVERQHATCYENETRDLVHEAVIYATMSYDGKLKQMAGLDDNIDALIGYKGDIYSGRMGIDDKKADIAAVNLYNRMVNSDGDIYGAIQEYNSGVADGSINESLEFLTIYGNGDPEKGMKKLKKEMDDESFGTWYLTGSYYGYGGGYGPGPYSYGDYGYYYNGQHGDVKTTREEFLQYLTDNSGISH